MNKPSKCKCSYEGNGWTYAGEWDMREAGMGVKEMWNCPECGTTVTREKDD